MPALPDGPDEAGAGVQHLLVHLKLLARVVGPAGCQQLSNLLGCLGSKSQWLNTNNNNISFYQCWGIWNYVLDPDPEECKILSV
jgi:hypothetical protein